MADYDVIFGDRLADLSVLLCKSEEWTVDYWGVEAEG